MIQSSAKTDMLEHSQAKVDLYSTYLATFLSIMRNVSHVEHIYIFDLFAGEGKYGDRSEGSPLIACQVIRDHYFSNKNSCPDITIWFNDNGLSKIEPGVKKIDRVERFVNEGFIPENIDIKYFYEDYDSLWPVALDQVKKRNNVKALFFIDPYGYKEIDPDNISEMMSAGNIEVLLFFPASHMYRFAAKSTACDFPGGTPLRSLLCKIYGENIPPFSSVHDFIKKFSQQFNNFIGTSYFAGTFKIERDKTNVYCLLFLTSNALGFEKMLEAKWKLDSSVGTGHRVEKTIPLFGRVELDCYSDDLFEFISKAEYRTNHDLYHFGLKKEFLPKHTNSVLGDLLKSESICRYTIDDKPARGNYIKYRSDRSVGFKKIDKSSN